VFPCFAAVGLYVSCGYSFGSAGKIGPGYFPILFAIVLCLLLVVRALTAGDEAIPALAPAAVFFLITSLPSASLSTLGFVLGPRWKKTCAVRC
jgi:putative tricarboxylic transport membrane protein